MAAVLEEFVKRLTDSGLLSADDVRACCEQLPEAQRPKDVEGLARELVRQKKLTVYQANLVYQGRTKGLVLGNYVVLDKIGEGGMGQVFKAEHRRMHRTVALKVLPKSVTKSPQAVQRFQREVQAAARLEHPNIVTAYDADEAAGIHFLVMQYVDGEDLAALIRKRGKLPIGEAVGYIIQAARGLAYAHAQGVVHRDIKPANLLVDRSGTVKVLDLGLALLDNVADAQAEGLTQAGQVMGTIDYMAPEQATNTHQADARADIYSLGCTLFRALTGENLYNSDTVVGKIMAHREQPIPALRSLRPDASATLEATFQRMVAKRPEDRFASMNDVITELERCQGSTPPVPPPIATQITMATTWQPPTTMEPVIGGQTMMAGATEKPGAKHVMLKVIGSVFATVIAPLVVALVVKYTDNSAPPSPAPVANPTSVAANVATTSVPKPTVPPPTPILTPTPAPPPLPPVTTPVVPPPKSVVKSPPAVTPTPVKPAPPAKVAPTIRLFNGRDLTGFYTYLGKPVGAKKALGKNHDPEKVFTVTNGRLLHVSGKVEGALTTEQVHTNYHLSLEYKWGEKTWPPFENKARNSGVLLHAHGLDYGFLEAFMPSIKVAIHEGHTGDLVMYSGEVQKVSLAAEGQVVRKFFQYKAGEPISTFSTGVVQGLNSTLDAKNEKGFRGPKELERPHGEWNQLECICKHDQIEVKLNGKTVNVAQKVTPARGRISLQSHGAEIFFRNLTLRQLD